MKAEPNVAALVARELHHLVDRMGANMYWKAPHEERQRLGANVLSYPIGIGIEERKISQTTPNAERFIDPGVANGQAKLATSANENSLQFK